MYRLRRLILESLILFLVSLMLLSCSKNVQPSQSGNNTAPTNTPKPLTEILIPTSTLTPIQKDLLVELNPSDEGWFIVIDNTAVPFLSQFADGMWNNLRFSDMPNVSTDRPVVLIRSSDIYLENITLWKILAGVGFGYSRYEGSERGTIVNSVTPGCGAEAAGLRVGDLIVAVDNVSLQNTNQDTRDLIIGPVESQVTLTVQRGTQLVDLTMVRNCRLQSDGDLGSQTVEFSYDVKQGGYAQLIPEQSLVEGYYCYGVGDWVLYCFSHFN